MEYFERLSKHEIASDLLIANNVLLAADKRVFLSFFDGVLELTNVIAGQFVEEYVMRDLLQESMLNRFDKVVFLFVDLETKTYRSADAQYITSHIVKGPFTPSPTSVSGYIIDLESIDPKPLPIEAAR